MINQIIFPKTTLDANIAGPVINPSLSRSFHCINQMSSADIKCFQFQFPPETGEVIYGPVIDAGDCKSFVIYQFCYYSELKGNFRGISIRDTWSELVLCGRHCKHLYIYIYIGILFYFEAQSGCS